MRIKTPMTKEKIRNHLHYGAWKYVVLLVAGIFGWDLIYTTTQYDPPQDKRIDVYLQTYLSSQEIVDGFMKPIWQEVTPEVEKVNSVLLMLDETYGQMQFSAYVAAADIDIVFLNEAYFKSFASSGLFMPLEELVADGVIEVDDVDLTKGYVTYVEDYDENMKPIVGDQHLYGIPLDSFYGYMDGMNVDNRGMYAAIAVNNGNDANVIPFFNALLQAGRGEKPEWLVEMEQQQ